jgi:hypothetical protein
MHEGLQIPGRKEVQEVTEKKLDVFGRAATSQKPRREAEDRGRTPNFQRELEVRLFSTAWNAGKLIILLKDPFGCAGSSNNYLQVATFRYPQNSRRTTPN